MKSSFFLIGITLCLYSCNFEDAGYYSDSFGVVKLSGNMQYIASDEGETLIPSQNVSQYVETGDRVWISYTVEQENARRDTLTILPYRVTRIMPLELQNETKLNEDGIDLWTVWVAQNFLTFDFRIRAKDQDKMKDHKYALVSPQKEITDTLFINFRHDAGEDNYGVLCRTAVTLKLNNLKTANDSVVIAIDYKNLKGVKQTEYRTYKKVN
jgi:hypothetical protein